MGKLPDTWRVVLEDGSTSGSLPAGRDAGVGRKLLAEVTDALSGGARGRRSGRPCSISMPAAPRQSFDALDHGLGSTAAPPRATTPGPRNTARMPKPTAAETAELGVKVPDRRPPCTDGDSALLAARAGSPRRELDARLARVIDFWPRLPRGMQAAILAMVEAEAAASR